MTNEEAIRIIDADLVNYDLLTEARRIATEALEKQMPKNPKTDARYTPKVCPICNGFVYSNWNFCANCGQAIDWGDSK